MKQALILLFATVLPFGLGGAAMAFIVAPAYRKAVQSGSEEAAHRLADTVAWNLTRDVARLERLAGWQELRRDLTVPPLSSARVAELEKNWTLLGADSPPIRWITENLVSRELRWLQQTDASAAEILVTNAKGHLTAASARPTDFSQADELWWQYAFNQGRGRVYISDPTFDRSTQVWAFDIAVPVYADGSPGSQAIGVVKLTLDMNQAFRDLRAVRIGEDGYGMLVDGRGRVLISPEAAPPLSQSVDPRALDRMRTKPQGSALVGTGADAMLASWSRVPLTERLDAASPRTPRLFAFTRRSAAAAYGPLRMVHQSMLVIGIVTILLAVGLGYYLVDRLVVRHIRMLAEGMRQLSRGDFTRAAEIADALLGIEEPAPDRPQPATRKRAST